jgi:gliding motility-associated protein GldM
MSSGGTPRQKMIGMMYLVLTALLAMNVSKSILDAFVIVNEGLERTNENFDKKNDKLYKDFKAALEKDPNKTKPYHDRALKAQKLSKELNEYIEKVKKLVIEKTDKKEKAVADTISLKYVDAKDNYDVPTEVLIGSEPATPIDGEMTALGLKKKVAKYKEEMIKLFDDKKLFLPADKKDMEGKLKAGLDLPDGVENGVKAGWEVVNFYHLPLAAVIVNLTALQSQVTNAEVDAVSKLLSAVSATDFKFDKLQAKVIAPSSVLIQGDEYKADVLLVASNSTSNPKILLCAVDTSKNDGETDPRLNKNDPGKEIPVSGGVGKYKTGTGSTGEQKWSGVIQVEKPGGGSNYYPFAASYIVTPPALIVSATKMNVLYIGVPNPVDISVPGYSPESITPSISGASISPDPAKKGSYIVNCSKGGPKEATISVSVKQGSTNKPMQGGVKFRVKSLPDPIAKVAGQKNGGEVGKALLAASPGVSAIMENFDFELKVMVASFDLTMNVAGDFKTESSSSYAFTPGQQAMLAKARNNSRVIFENIKVRLPDGTTRNLGTVALKVKG